MSMERRQVKQSRHRLSQAPYPTLDSGARVVSGVNKQRKSGLYPNPMNKKRRQTSGSLTPTPSAPLPSTFPPAVDPADPFDHPDTNSFTNRNVGLGADGTMSDSSDTNSVRHQNLSSGSQDEYIDAMDEYDDDNESQTLTETESDSKTTHICPRRWEPSPTTSGARKTSKSNSMISKGWYRDRWMRRVSSTSSLIRGGRIGKISGNSNHNNINYNSGSGKGRTEIPGRLRSGSGLRGRHSVYPHLPKWMEKLPGRRAEMAV